DEDDWDGCGRERRRRFALALDNFEIGSAASGASGGGGNGFFTAGCMVLAVCCLGDIVDVVPVRVLGGADAFSLLLWDFGGFNFAPVAEPGLELSFVELIPSVPLPPGLPLLAVV